MKTVELHTFIFWPYCQILVSALGHRIGIIDYIVRYTLWDVFANSKGFSLGKIEVRTGMTKYVPLLFMDMIIPLP